MSPNDRSPLSTGIHSGLVLLLAVLLPFLYFNPARTNLTSPFRGTIRKRRARIYFVCSWKFMRFFILKIA